MKLELTKPSSLRAILMMGVFIFVFLLMFDKEVVEV